VRAEWRAGRADGCVGFAEAYLGGEAGGAGFAAGKGVADAAEADGSAKAAVLAVPESFAAGAVELAGCPSLLKFLLSSLTFQRTGIIPRPFWRRRVCSDGFDREKRGRAMGGPGARDINRRGRGRRGG
jgi:hypothetical protein